MSVAYATEPPAPRTKVIASKARAAQIIEQVARKHDLTPAVVLCARWDRFAMAARAECAAELKGQLGWSQRAIGAHLGCTQPNVRKLFIYHEMNGRRAKRWLPAADVQALARLEGQALGLRLIESEERTAELESEVRRLTGAHLAPVLADALGLGGEYGGRFGGVLLLGIVTESYPSVVLGPNILELYDEACLRLGFGSQRGAGYSLMTKNASNIARHFRDNGWPAPTEPGDLSRSRRLTDECAVFLHERIGHPFGSQMRAAEEIRERQQQSGAKGGSQAVRAGAR